MLETGLAPGLRSLGFTGAGRRFRMAVDGHWAEVAVIQARSVTEGRVRFTLHLRVSTRDEWVEQLRVRPYYPAPARDPRPAWEAPIGALILVAGHPIEDLWWELEVGKPFDSLSAEVLTTLRVHGLPAISHHLHTPR
ncbi:MAG TPA: hypothetical protein VGX25_28375 [Actinophytocola sp.]|uniref:DUF4304 domain-containing protein n=1 Tax=Actinophytocola sp. TaxID=1872138 RepID=UPI002DDD4CD6|nr:hypothetical protein [Actinophytocola sp.]HEV2783318.1 hypothetical protein [Actinophytocola sp.]